MDRSGGLIPRHTERLSAFAAAKARAKSLQASFDNAADSTFDTDQQDYPSSRRASIDSDLVPVDAGGDNSDDVDRSTEEAQFRNVQLSSWNPKVKSTSSLKLTEDTITIELKPGETLTFIGIYDILVKSGAITLYGAMLKAGKQLFRVYAPASHAVPVIQGSPVGKTIIEIKVVKNELQGLARLSPLFKRMWNRDKDVPVEIKSFSKRSFQFVSLAFVSG